MAGDKRKNHFASSIILDGTQDHYNVKKSNSGFSRYDPGMKSSISVKWDDSKRSVVAKTEQIGLSRRELIHFADGILPHHNNLADVITVPPEIFRLDNLDDVLTSEVWQNCLSESEKSFLSQFLPKYCNPDRVVQQLLSGDNFHFGNPFLKWGALLCSGNLHPDNILTTERCSRATKKTYYSELQTYHTEMIENLQILKERVVDYKDLKEDTIRRMWRSRSNSKKRVFTTEPGVPEMEGNVHTPESSCRAASELVCSSDNPNGISVHSGISRRKGSKIIKIDDSSDGLKDVSKLSKGEKLIKHNIQHGDGTRFMSYIKVSKSQHQRIKSSMKHSSSCIQPKSLHSVLGDINAFHIQPLEVYEEEEWQKLHGHWLQLANRDLPPFVANWRNLQLQRLQISKSLVQEMEEKLKRQKESFDQDIEESSCDVSLELLGSLDGNDALAMKELDAEPLMPAVEVPALTFEKTPLMIEEDAPATAMTLDEWPAMTEEEAPAVTDEKSPAITDEKSPAMTEKEFPTMTDEESSKLTEYVYHKSFLFEAFDQGDSPATATTLDKSPSITEEETPAMDEEESPAMTEEESPTMTNEESSKLAKEGELQSIGLMEQQQDNELGEVGLVTFEDKERENSIGDAGNFVSVPTQSDRMHQTISLNNGFLHYDDMNIETCGNLDLKKEETSLSSSKYSLNLGNIDVPVNQEDSIASVADTWPQVNIPDLFYPSTSMSHGYSSSNGLSLGHAQVEEQSSQLLHLDAFNLERMGGRGSLDAFNGENIGGRGTLQRHSDPSPFLGRYHNQDRNELYPSFYKSETDLSFQDDQKPTGIHFLPAANLLVETGQYSGRMKEQLHFSLPLELGQKGPSEFYLNPNIQGSMYSNGGSYPIQSQETLPLNARDWTVNTVNISAPPQTHMNGGLVSQNWYSRDNPARGGWSCMEGSVGPSQGIGSGSSSDQSLFRVLSECNELQSGAQYDPMSSSRRLMQSGSFGGVHTTSHMFIDQNF